MPMVMDDHCIDCAGVGGMELVDFSSHYFEMVNLVSFGTIFFALILIFLGRTELLLPPRILFSKRHEFSSRVSHFRLKLLRWLALFTISPPRISFGFM